MNPSSLKSSFDAIQSESLKKCMAKDTSEVTFLETGKMLSLQICISLYEIPSSSLQNRQHPTPEEHGAMGRVSEDDNVIVSGILKKLQHVMGAVPIH